MSLFKENNYSEMGRETARLETREMDAPHFTHNAELGVKPSFDSKDIFKEAFKSFGLTTDVSKAKASGKKDVIETKNHSSYLEKGNDGKYYSKETGKSYDSIGAWEKAQETLGKRYDSTAIFFEKKAQKEWARFKNAESNDESDGEKWNHYQRSQEYYAKAQEYAEKAKNTRIKLGETSDS